MEDIYAHIINEDFLPIGKDFIISDDDFSEAVAAAAVAKQPCCIVWFRESDGQQGYYGPRGCSLQPYWYNRKG